MSKLNAITCGAAALLLATLAGARATETVGLGMIYADYATNEKVAKQKYDGAEIVVNAVFKRALDMPRGEYGLKLHDRNQPRAIADAMMEASEAKAVERLKAGDLIKIRCAKVKPGFDGLFFDRCTFAETKK